MSIYTWWNGERMADPGRDATLSRIVPTWQKNQPLYSREDYRTLVDDGYRRNVIIYACIREIASSVSEPKLVVQVKTRDGFEQVSEDHPLRVLLAEPNRDQDMAELLDVLLMHYNIAGEFFVHKIRSQRGRVVQLEALRPDRIAPVAGALGQVERYEYKVDAGMTRSIDAADIVCMRNPDPLDDYRGLSPITVAARMGDLDNQSADYMRSYFLNGGVPRGFLTSTEIVGPEERQRVRTTYRDNYGGERGWNQVGVLDGGWKYESVGDSPKDADTAVLMDVSETRLCMVFGVPPIVVGARVGLEHATYANYREARRSLWQETLSPLYRRVAAVLTRGLAGDFGGAGSLRVGWDMSEVMALKEDKDKVWARAVDGWTRGILTRNEARVLIGMPRQIDGDVIRDDGSLLDPVANEAMARAAIVAEQMDAA